MKHISLKIVCMALCMMMGISAMAQTTLTINGLKYQLNGTEAYVCGYEGNPIDVVIPTTIESDGLTFKVTQIKNAAFQGCSSLISLTIGSGVLSIGDNAFNNTSVLKVIWLTNTPPNGYSQIKSRVNYVANNQYSNLSNVMVYPYLSSLFEVNGVKYVPVSPSERTCDAIDCAYNESIENLTIYGTVVNKSITLTVKRINPYFCHKNIFIKSVTLNNQGDIGNNAFSDCTNLSEANISNHGNIESLAFDGCTALQTAELGEKITSIGYCAFCNCSNLLGIVIPDLVTTIGSYAFDGCIAMTSAKLGNGVQTIRSYTFSGCSSLRNIEIGTGVTSIERYAFKFCSSLPTIQIPQNVSTINDYAFYGCTDLKTVLFDDGKTELTLGSNGSDPLLASCPLDSVYIGRNINYPTDSSKGYSPFYRNTKLRSVTITDKETEISTNEFYGCTNLKNVRIGDGVKSFGDWAFSGCSSLDYFSFGSSVKTIGKEAFSDCTAMTRLISKATTPPTCGSQALDDINKWECTLVVPRDYTTAYQQADQWKEFFFIEESTDPILATGISLNQTTLSFNAVNQTATLTATVMPSNATNTKVSWTSSDTSVATVSDEGVVTPKANGTTIITAKTTDGTNITATCCVTVTVTAPIEFADANVKAICIANWDINKDGELDYDEAATVKSLGNVFKGKESITSFNELQYFTGLLAINNGTFSGCTGLTSITIPNSVTSIGADAFSGCI